MKHGPFQPAKAGMAKREMPPVAPLLASKDAIISSTVSWLSRSSTLSSSLASGFLQVDPTWPRKVESQDQRRYMRAVIDELLCVLYRQCCALPQAELQSGLSQCTIPCEHEDDQKETEDNRENTRRRITCVGCATIYARCKHKKYCHDSETWLHVLATTFGHRHS